MSETAAVTRTAPFSLGVVLVAALVLGGCGAVMHTFADQDAEQVWKAMVAVAGQPRYDDWTVLANDVWVDEPGAKPRNERRTWDFEVRLPGTDPPEARFVTRGTTVPSHAQAEARRYFDDVGDLLSGLPGESVFEPRDQDLLDALGLDESGPPDE